MAARIIDGRQIAHEVRGEVAVRAGALVQVGVTPGLAVVLVGDDPASAVYVRSKTQAAREAAVAVFDHRLPATTSQRDLEALVDRLNQDPAVDGILVQLPLPPVLDSRAILERIRPEKDVDGFHPVNVGKLWSGGRGFVPCTPLGVMRLMASVDTPLSGADAVVVGRSNIVGKPMAALLMAADATVTVCHSRTRDLAERIARADIVVAAIGRAAMIRGDWIKTGATVIDVGMNRVDGRWMGDVEFAAAAERARALTPVPGGVGPMTIAMLLSNTVDSAENRRVE